MSEQFSDNVRAVLERAETEASSRNLPEVSSELVLLGLASMEGTAAHVLRALNITPERLIDCMPVATSPKPTPRPIPFGQSAVRAVNGAHQEAARMGHDFVGTEHLLLGTLAEPSGRVPEALTRIGRDAVVVRERLLDLLVSPGFVSPEAPRSAPEPADVQVPVAPAPIAAVPVAPAPIAAAPVAPAPIAAMRSAPVPPADAVIDLRDSASSPTVAPGIGATGNHPDTDPSTNGHAAPPATPWSQTPPATPRSQTPPTDANAVITALLGELVLLRTEIAALRAEMVSLRSVRH